METTEKFVILHLSDAHIGKNDELDESVVLKSLYADIEEVHRTENITPNLIVFTGDLIQGCSETPCGENCLNGSDNVSCRIKKQLDSAKIFLETVLKKSGIPLDRTIPLLIVPGNHDVNRHLVDLNHKLARKTFTKDAVEEIQKDSIITWPLTIRRQKQWFETIRRFPNSLEWDEHYLVPSGKLSFAGKTIGVAGFNTSWCSFDKNEKNLLWVGKHQYNSIGQKIDGCDFTIIASHHPSGYLNEQDYFTEHRINPRFNIYLHGHLHEQWFVDAKKHLKIEGGAVYENSDQKNVYSWLVLDFHNKTGEILFRTYTSEGKSGWIPAPEIPNKIGANGRGSIEALFLETEKEPTLAQEQNAHSVSKARNKVRSLSTNELIEDIREKFKIRWEPNNFKASSDIQVFWPVKLRYPTAIHAAQCFIAAALQMTGATVNLYIDDLGREEYDQTEFKDKIKHWFERVGGNYTDLVITNYSSVEKDFGEIKREYTERFLSTQQFKAEYILRISKIWHSSGNSERIIGEIRSRRAARLLAPPMTWTCLHQLCKISSNAAILTLGGNDEKTLWDAWIRGGVRIEQASAGHLYVTELQNLHMAENPLEWRSDSDIESEFKKHFPKKNFISYNEMIPWCINNCVLIPNYLTENSTITFAGKSLSTIDDFIKMRKVSLEECVQTVSRWLL